MRFRTGSVRFADAVPCRALTPLSVCPIVRRWPARLHGEPEIAFVRYLYAASASLHHWHRLRAGLGDSHQGDRQTAFVRCCSGCLKSGTCSLRTASTSSATSRARRPCFTRCSPHDERRSLAGSRQRCLRRACAARCTS
jgi:hypothetical protein